MPKEGSANTNSALEQKAKGERNELEPGARTPAPARNRGVKPALGNPRQRLSTRTQRLGTGIQEQNCTPPPKNNNKMNFFKNEENPSLHTSLHGGRWRHGKDK